MGQWGSFWKANLKDGEAILRQALLSHIITAKHAAPLMIARRRGLIVEVTESDILDGGRQPDDAVGRSCRVKGTGAEHGRRADAARCRGRGDHARLPPLRDDAGALRRHRSQLARRRQEGQELPRVGVAAVRRPRGRGAGRGSSVLERTGQLCSSWELAREYGFTDADGRRPDWGALQIDFSELPPFLLAIMRDGARMQLEWMKRVSQKTEHFLSQLGPES